MPIQNKMHLEDLFKLELDQIKLVEIYFFGGSVAGGRSLFELLEAYKKQGPYSIVRIELLQQLQRCIVGFAQMEATIIARCRTTMRTPVDYLRDQVVKEHKRKKRIARKRRAARKSIYVRPL